jgi:hypothetical protein
MYTDDNYMSGFLVVEISIKSSVLITDARHLNRTGFRRRSSARGLEARALLNIELRRWRKQSLYSDPETIEYQCAITPVPVPKGTGQASRVEMR